MDKDTIWVITGEQTRGSGLRQLNIEDLSTNINHFIKQIGSILEKTPDKIGKFNLDELEINADITAKGAIAVVGTGVELGAAGGLKFVFHRSSADTDEK